MIFSKSEGSYLHTPLYKGKNRAVIFPSINSVKSQPLDLYHTVERGGHIAACCINCRIKDTKVLGTCMGHVKRHFYVGTHSECAYPPTSYLLPKPHSLKWQREWSFGGLIWEGEAQRRNITRQVRPEEKVGLASH